MGGVKKAEPGSSQWCPLKAQKAMDTIETQEIPLKHKMLFAVTVVEHWHRSPREVLEFPF